MQTKGSEHVTGSKQVLGFNIRLPEDLSGCDQDEEWFDVLIEDRWLRYRLHDYASIFRIPGLYEALVYQTLKCSSPEKLTRLLKEVVDEWPVSLEDLRVLDLGAGNGIVGQYLRRLGVPTVVGIDLLEEARRATLRDRPGVYDDYLVVDLGRLKPKEEMRLRDYRFRGLTAVASLGFGDIPPPALAKALGFVSTPGWVAMTLKEDFLTGVDSSGFSRFVRGLLREGVLELEAQFRYWHRLSVSGEKLFYVALVGKKLREVPDSLLTEQEEETELTSDKGSPPLIADTRKDLQ